MISPPFWKTKTLAEMSACEWESLCDGCGKCCLVKLQDADSEQISYTDAACKLLDITSCRCTDYVNRTTRVPDCMRLSPKTRRAFRWLPSSCAYRLLAEGKDLPSWHPLVSGDAAAVHAAGMSVRDRAISEREVENFEARIVRWPE